MKENSPQVQTGPFYFVYGWPLDAELLARLCPGAQSVAVAALADYDIGFFGHSARWGGAEEAILPAAGRTVWGVVLTLEAGRARCMDGLYNVHGDGSGTYFHFPAEVRTAAGQRYATLLYMRTALGAARAPSSEYLEHITRGAQQHRLPAAYVDRLQSFPAHPAGHAVPRGLIRTIAVVDANDEGWCDF